MSGEGTIYEHAVSDLQTGVAVEGDKITGTLKYVTTGALPAYWGAGNFLALDLNDIDTTGLTSLKVGLMPSQGSGLVEALGDEDMTCAGKITDKDTQKFVIVATDGTQTARVEYDLSGLTLETGD